MADTSIRLSKTAMTPLRRAMTSLSLSSAPPPVIVSALKEANVKHEDALEYLRCSTDESAIKMLALYDSLVRTEQSAITIDHLRAAANVEPAKVLGIITEQMYTRNVAVTGMIAAAGSPSVMKKAVQYAKTKDGFQHAKMILQTTGVAPVPKTQNTFYNIKNSTIDNSKNQIIMPTLEEVMKSVDTDLDDVLEGEIVEG